MAKVSCFLLIPLLPVLTYSMSLDFDVTLVEKIILHCVESSQSYNENKYYCINKTSELGNFIKSFSKIVRKSNKNKGDIRVIFKTKDNDYVYWILKNSNDSLINHYIDLVNNKPNWFQYKIVSNRFDLFDTTLNYLRTNYYVEPLDKVQLISHRVRIESKELIAIDDTNKFIELVNSINERYCTVSNGSLKYGSEQKGSRTGVIHIMEIYFKDIFTLTEAMRYVDSVKWVKIKDVEIKNDYEIRFWVETISRFKGFGREIINGLENNGIKVEKFNRVN